MSCIRCKSKRVLTIRARAKDEHDYEFMGKKYEEQYACDFGLPGGDVTEIKVCLECGQVQDKFPMRSMLEEEQA